MSTSFESFSFSGSLESRPSKCKNHFLASIPCLLLAVLPACRDQSSDSQLSWGHIQDEALLPSSPQYLINKKPGETYRICLAPRMAQELPGVAAELEAAVKIWGSYIGRSIPVDVKIANEAECGESKDLIADFTALNSSTVGRTGASWRGFGPDRILSFRRTLELRDYTKSPDPIQQVENWESLEMASGQSRTAQEIVELLQRRSELTVSAPKKAMTLPVIVHEMGHVWGLCDQYEGANNCDPRHSSTHPELKSIMGASSGINRLYLTDDDITGIRELAKRPGFSEAWPGTESSLSVAVKPISESAIPYFKLRALSREDRTYTLNFGVLTSQQGGELYIEYRSKGTSAWRQSPSYFPSEGKFEIPSAEYKLTMPDQKDYEFRLKLKLVDASGKATEELISEVL